MAEIPQVSDAQIKALLRPLAVSASGLSGADIERLVREARQLARRAGRVLTYSDLETAIMRGRPKMASDVKWRVSTHEAGHAIAWTLTKIGRVVRMTTGQPSGGQTQVEFDTSRLEDEQFFADILCGLLAGRAAESVVFGNVFAGSGGAPESDLAQATLQAVKMESVLGMSNESPLLYIPSRDLAYDLRLNPALASKVNARLEAAFDRAKTLLKTHKSLMIALARKLDSQTVLEAEEIAAILAEHALGPPP
jgi:cell division protease FtsH